MVDPLGPWFNDGMSQGSYRLRDTAPMVRTHCLECHRFAQFGRDRLLDRFGPGIAMPDMLGKLRPCGGPSIGISSRPCRLAYWDNMTAEGRLEALAKGGLPKGWATD